MATTAVISVHLPGTAIAEGYKAPFSVSVQRETHGSKDLTKLCAEPPRPIVNFTASKGGPAKETRSTLYRYQRKLNEISDAYVRSKPANQILAQCAHDWLYLWARQGAALGKADAAGKFVRKSVLASVALAYLKIRPGEPSDPGERKVILDWLNRWGHAIREEYSTNTDATSRRNFHLYEAALSVMTAGIATGDSELVEWSIDRTRFALNLISDDGVFPWALARGKKALKFQLQSIGPLVIIAELAAANGINLYEEENEALQRLVTATMEGISNPSKFSTRLGVKQVGIANLDLQDMAWLTVYNSRFPMNTGGPWLRKTEAPRSRILGGDMKLLYTDSNNRRANIEPFAGGSQTSESSEK